MSPSDTYKKKTSRNGQEQHEKFSGNAVSLMFHKAIGRPLDHREISISISTSWKYTLNPQAYKTIAYKSACYDRLINMPA